MTSKKETRYSHAPIAGPKNIRLLRVCPTTFPDDTVECIIFQKSLDQLPNYRAISYAWEGQKPTATALCSGQRLLITPNCEAILRYLAAQKDDDVPVWIDAICIDQSQDAVHERNHQVKLMAQIYGISQEVLVWLGHALDPRWMTSIQQLSTLAGAVRMYHDERLMSELLQIVNSMDLEGLNQIFYGIPWFSRVWVVQEVALSRKTFLVYGSTTVPYDDLLQCWNALMRIVDENAQVLRFHQVMCNGFSVHVASLTKERGLPTLTGGSIGVEDLVAQTRRLSVWEPRDKVYGLHALLTQLGFPLPDPDYRRSKGEVYTEAARTIISTSGSLKLLQHCSGGSKGMPSWVPDWSNTNPPTEPIGSELYIASQDSKPNFSFVQDQLHTRAVLIEGVHSTAGTSLLGRRRNKDTLERDDVLPKVEDLVAPEWSDLRRNHPDDLPRFLQLFNIRSLRKVLRFAEDCETSDTRSLDSDHDSHTQLRELVRHQLSAQSDPNFTNTFTAWINLLRSLPLSPSEFSETKSTPLSLRDLYDTAELEWHANVSKHPAVSSLHETLLIRSCFLTFFKTSSGKLGIGPHTITSGDQVALVAGCPMPVIVRRVSPSHFEFVSVVYISGLMYGEAWRDTAPDLDSIVFV